MLFIFSFIGIQVLSYIMYINSLNKILAKFVSWIVREGLEIPPPPLPPLRRHSMQFGQTRQGRIKVECCLTK